MDNPYNRLNKKQRNATHYLEPSRLILGLIFFLVVSIIAMILMNPFRHMRMHLMLNKM